MNRIYGQIEAMNRMDVRENRSNELDGHTGKSKQLNRMDVGQIEAMHQMNIHAKQSNELDKTDSRIKALNRMDIEADRSG